MVVVEGERASKCLDHHKAQKAEIDHRPHVHSLQQKETWGGQAEPRPRQEKHYGRYYKMCMAAKLLAVMLFFVLCGFGGFAMSVLIHLHG